MDHDEVLHKMRELLDLYVDSGKPPQPDTSKFFAEHPAECDELLRLLFEEYDDGQKTDREIEALIGLRRLVSSLQSPARSAALRRMDVLHAAYFYPPPCRHLMFQQLWGVVHFREPFAQCEALVRKYPSVATELIAQLLRSQKHDHFYSYSHGTTLFLDTQAEIDALRAMAARAIAGDILAEIDAEKPG